jgi:ribosomal protein S27AE
MKHKSCPKCESADIIPEWPLLEYGHLNQQFHLHVGINEDPDAILFKGHNIHVITAWICGNCGYLEQYVQDPKVLFERYLQLKLQGKVK